MDLFIVPGLLVYVYGEAAMVKSSTGSRCPARKAALSFIQQTYSGRTAETYPASMVGLRTPNVRASEERRIGI